MRHWLQAGSMPMSLNIHQPELVNTLGHCAGMLLFGYLFCLLVRDLRGRSGERPVLPAIAALLAFIWNAGSLFALGSRSGTGGDLPTALSFAALSLLPAVLLSISLRNDARVLRYAGWLLSAVAVALHIAEVFVIDAPLHQWGLILIAVGFTALAALAAFHAGRQRASRIIVPIALLFFAASFVHFTQNADAHLWSRELALHHAGIPLALYIVLQDYRFLMADVFMRGLTASALAAVMTVLAVLASDRWNLAGAASGDAFKAGLVIAGACTVVILFSSLRTAVDRALTKYLFRRRGISEAIRELADQPLPASEQSLLELAAAIISRFIQAERYELREGSPDLILPQPVQIDDASWAEVAVPIRFARSDGALLLLGRREGGRRYLSGDFEDLARFAHEVSARVERFRDQERERLAARAELRALQAQINPHFLFNSLNALYGSIPRTAADARRTVLNLSEIFRYFLQNDRASIPVADELEIVRAYLEIEQLRLGDRLRTEIAVDPDVLSENIPALTIEPLVENAVKHGIAPHPGPGTVRVSVQRVPTGVEIAVTDSGPGFQSEKDSDGAGVGLDNVRQRLLMTYGPDADVRIETTDAGTSVSFRIPSAGGTLADRFSGSARSTV